MLDENIINQPFEIKRSILSKYKDNQINSKSYPLVSEILLLKLSNLITII